MNVFSVLILISMGIMVGNVFRVLAKRKVVSTNYVSEFSKAFGGMVTGFIQKSIKLSNKSP